jgi:hypothetical protein
MLGWNISLFRQQDGGVAPAAMDSATSARLAVWQTGLDGLKWIDELVQTGKAIVLGGNGYPSRYTATAEHLLPRIMDQPPGARETWVFDSGDILTDKWEGKTVVDIAAASQCRLDEWLVVEAWDES